MVFVLLPGRRHARAVGNLRRGCTRMENGLTPAEHARNLRATRYWVVDCISASAGRALIVRWFERAKNPLVDPNSYPATRMGRVLESGAPWVRP